MGQLKLLTFLMFFSISGILLGQTQPHWLQVRGAPTVDVRIFGLVGDGTTDNTTAWSGMVASLPEGSHILFPRGEYRGSFAASKSLHLDFNGSTLIPVAGDAGIHLSGSGQTLIGNVVGSATYGMTTIETNIASGVSAGDILLIDDGTVRSFDSFPQIKAELVRVSAVSGTTLELDTQIGAKHNANASIYKIDAIQGITIKNLIIDIPESYTGRGVYISGAKDVILQNIHTSGNTNDCIRVVDTYGVTANNIHMQDARGDYLTLAIGYGFTTRRSRNIYYTNISGKNVRNVTDFDTTYNTHLKDIRGHHVLYVMALAHNGFGGFITVDGVKASLVRAGVICSNVASDSTSFVPDVSIRNVSVAFGEWPSSKTKWGISAVSNNLEISGLTLSGDPLGTTGEPGFRSIVVGLPQSGAVANIKGVADYIGAVGTLQGHPSSFGSVSSIVNISRYYTKGSEYSVFSLDNNFQGALHIEDLVVETTPFTAVVEVNADSPSFNTLRFSGNCVFPGNTRLVFGQAQILRGGDFTYTRDPELSIHEALALTNVYQSGRSYINLRSTAPTTIGSICGPTFLGQELRLSSPDFTTTVPSTAQHPAFSIASGEYAILRQVGQVASWSVDKY